MSGKLYVVGTPIGNLGDITYRAVETLKNADFICAEDTRVTIKLLNRFEIKKPLLSCHEHSAPFVFDEIISRIENGENCAVVSDAGMPCISDPGEDLVKKCYEKGIKAEVIPGASAVVSAVAISGLPASRFAFEGFLSVTKKQRCTHLEQVKNDTRTLVFYEAPHKLIKTLEDMLSVFGDRKISLCRELTKIHEEVIRTTLSGALEYYKLKTPRGEYVLVIEGYAPSGENCFTFEEALIRADELIKSGLKPADACREIAKITGYKKSELYKSIIRKN